MEDFMVLTPRTSEKTYKLSQTSRSYTIVVPGSATKHTVARAVAQQYKVTVESVNIVKAKGKAKRTVRRGGRAVNGRQSDMKKAYVTLKAGETLPFFADIEEAAKSASKPAKKSSEGKK